MLDIEFIRSNRDRIADAVQKKQLSFDLDELMRVDEERRSLVTQRDQLLAERNKLSTDEAKQRGPALKQELQAIEPRLAEIETRFHELMLLVPQIPASDVPVGDETANTVVRTVGTPTAFSFTPKDHLELGRTLDLIDLESGASVGGARSYFLKNEAVLLHHGLMQLGLRLLRSRGFTLMVPPTVVREFPLIGSGHFPFGKAEVYQVGNAARLEDMTEKESRYLVGTAEPSLLGYYANKTLEASQLPVKVCGISQCYRSEAGSYGKDTKGLYRVHEFMKVEQVMLCEADDVAQTKYFEEMLAIAEELLMQLELPYRVLEIATGDMGAGKVKMYDIETWMPSRDGYGETHSNSALGDWQARRLGIKYRTAEGEKRHVYTLNNTVVASPRILIALLENHQQVDGSIRIPKALQEFVGTDILPTS